METAAEVCKRAVPKVLDAPDADIAPRVFCGGFPAVRLENVARGQVDETHRTAVAAIPNSNQPRILLAGHHADGFVVDFAVGIRGFETRVVEDGNHFDKVGEFIGRDGRFIHVEKIV